MHDENEDYEDEDMPATERELADDAQWKVIQKNTFTRWANEHLKTVNKILTSLDTDLSDGLRLIALVEVLSGKKFRHINKRPNFRTQKLENVTMSLKFLEDDEGIRIVNIDSTDIVDSNLKLILGLIWTLILHYSISMPMWEGEDSGKEGATPKQKLLGWIQGKVPDLPIKNFTTDWNDGKAIGALVDSVGPGLCPDWEDWDPKSRKKNTKEAMDNAEKWLDVPQLIKPEEMINPKVDDLSMMTYLSQFPNAKLKPGAPLRPRINANRVRAYGPGIEPTGNMVGAPARFTVETFSAGRGEVEVTILNPNGQQEKCEIHFNNDRNVTYSCVYTPAMEGKYKVIVKFAGKEIPKSPFVVGVEGAAGDAAKCSAAGPGIERHGVQATRKTYFEIFTKGAGKGTVEVVILDPHGHKDTIRPVITSTTVETYMVEYVPKDVGIHSVSVFFAGKQIPLSPFTVGVSPPVDPKKCYATGRGVQPKGVRVKDAADFKVHTKGAGNGDLQVQIIGPGGINEKCQLKKIDEDTYEGVYYPMKIGQYIVNITFSGQHILKSPFKVDVGPFKQSKIRAYGPGLEGGTCGLPATFIVETNGETGALGFSIEGPSQAKIDCNDNGDGSADVTYWPTAPGEYAVHVLCEDEDIQHSPFCPIIQPPTDLYEPLKVKCYGPGLEKNGVIAGEFTEFTVDTRMAGRAPLNITCLDKDYQPVEVQVKDNKDGTYTCRYNPRKHVKHTITVSYGGVNVPQSPFRVYVQEPSNPSKVKVYGPGVEKGVKTFEPTYFVVDCKEAGPGNVAIALTDEQGMDVPVDIQDNQDGTFTITYEPKSVGKYTVSIYFAEQEIPSSPIRIQVEPSIDVSKVQVDGLENSVFLDSTTDFTVNAESVTPTGEGKVRAIITSPSGTKHDTIVKNNKDGSYKVSYTPVEEGPHQIDVTYEGLPIPKTPFPVEVRPGCDPTRVRAFGPGLEGGNTNQPQLFTVETRGAGQGGLGLAIEGPSEAKMTCRDNRDGSCSVEYLPLTPGKYDITIKFADQDIPGSPFTVGVDDVIDASKCRVYGPGLERPRAAQPATFVVDCSEAGQAPLECTYTSATDNQPKEADIVDNGDMTYSVTYLPVEEGPCTVDVSYGNEAIPNSPFVIPVQPSHDASAVKVTGPGLQTGIPASFPISFVIDTSDAGIADLDVSIQAPDGSFVKPNIKDNGDGTYTITYTPEDIGRYTIKIQFGGENVPDAPFTVESVPTGDASKCKITDGLNKTVMVGEECVITVNCAEAGMGNVTCRIHSPSDTDVDIDIEDNGDGTFTIFYTPRTQGAYSINIKFGGQSVPSGEMQQMAGEEVIRADTVDAVHSALPLFGQPGKPEDFAVVDFRIEAGPIFNSVDAEVKMPSGNTANPEIIDNGDGSVTLRYNPVETGLHEMFVSYNKEPIPGSPFTFHVDSINAGYVTAYGPGLSHGVAGEECKFTINTKDAGAGGLSLAVEGPSRAEITCKDNKDGTCDVSYYPMLPGEYKIICKFDGKHIAGSPFIAKVSGEGRKKSQLATVGSASEVSIQVHETDINSLSAVIEGPSGHRDPCILKRLQNGHLGISFTPHETGEHLVHISKNGHPIQNSPFRITVAPTEIGNASKVKVNGAGLVEGMANEVNDFVVDTKEAGYGGLSLAVEGPSKADIQCHDTPDGNCLVSYKPTEPGTYLITVKFADEHVPGSPFAVKVGGEPSGRIIEKITKRRECADITHVGSTCELSLKLPGTSPFDMMATVTAPSGVTDLCDILDKEDNHYVIKFTPKEMGIHTVSVKHKEMHIPGSPFQFTVGPITEGGAHKVHASGPGLERAEVAFPAEFNIYTREAGAGGLSIAVEGPSKSEISFDDRKDGTCGVSYLCHEPGEYVISVKFNDDHIPDSPFNVSVSPSHGEAKKIQVGTMQQKELQINKAAAFTVDSQGAKGKITAYVEAPSGAKDQGIVTEVDDGHYAVRFIPRENGRHLVHVKLDGIDIPHSPFVVCVGKMDADIGLVHAYGEGLSKGRTNTANKFIVSTMNAGAAALSVTIDGPSKVQLKCIEIEEGYEFSYVPAAPGNYLIAIKYAGNHHIAGSPFKAVIEGDGQVSSRHEQSTYVMETVEKSGELLRRAHMPKFTSDASKVQSKGMGLKKTFVNKKSQFTVDTKDAGPNMLFVGVMGPAGAPPCDEILIKHAGNFQYNVTYNVKEKGTYLLMVKWGDEHIPGSPFTVDVL